MPGPPSKLASPVHGLTVLVTGAASGIGRQLALDLWTREGCGVRLVDRDAAGLAALEQELRQAAPADGRVLSTHVVDVSSTPTVCGLADALGDGPLDVLVNCAGILNMGPFEDARLEDLERVVEVNLLGTLRMTRVLLPRLLASPRGFIVNVASAAGLCGAPGMAAYSASKFGVVGLSDALRIELDGRVGVCAVCPTRVRTEIVKRASVAGPEGVHDARRAEMGQILEQGGSAPSRVSRAIVRAVVKRKRLVLVNPDAYLIHYMDRFFPGLTRWIVTRLYRRLRRGWMGDA